MSELKLAETWTETEDPAPKPPDAEIHLPPPVAVSLMELAATPPDPAKTLLGDRFLCIDGGALFVGP